MFDSSNSPICSPPVAPMEDTVQLRTQVIEACNYLTDIGYCIGTWGNVSVRVENGLLITPSGMNYRTMVPEDLVVVSWDGNETSGTRKPSSEAELHRLLLIKRPDFGAVVHTHSPYASTVSAARRSIPPVTEDTAQILGGEVKCTEHISGALHKKLAEAAYEAMGQQTVAVLLANHGPVVGGRTLAEAVIASQVLEKAASIVVHASALGECHSISDDQVREERYRYLFHYGVE